MRVLVTGAAGFLGSHLCQRLLEMDYEVIGIDSLVTGRLENLASAYPSNQFTMMMGDIVDGVQIKGIQQIYNMACPASPPRYREHSLLTYRTCVMGVYRLLELASSSGARFLQASTSEVYGNPTTHPQPEKYFGNVNPIGPRAIYDEGKRAAESIVAEFERLGMADVRIARIFNTYGPNMDPKDGRVVSNFITQALQNNPITMYGDGSQTRSFCYVSDLIDGLVLLMNHSESIGPVNLGNPEEFSVQELALMIVAQTQSTSAIEYLEKMEDDPQIRCPDISKAHTQLGFQPRVVLQEGLTHTIDYFRKEIIREVKTTP